MNDPNHNGSAPPNLFDNREMARRLLQNARGRRMDPRYLNADREEQWNRGRMRANPGAFAPEVEPGVPLRCFEVGGLSHAELVSHQLEGLDQADRCIDSIEHLMETAPPEAREALSQIRDLCQPNQPARLDVLAVHPGHAASETEVRAFANSLSRRDPR